MLLAPQGLGKAYKGSRASHLLWSRGSETRGGLWRIAFRTNGCSIEGLHDQRQEHELQIVDLMSKWPDRPITNISTGNRLDQHQHSKDQ